MVITFKGQEGERNSAMHKNKLTDPRQELLAARKSAKILMAEKEKLGKGNTSCLRISRRDTY